jgi:hypothetical protein
MHGHQLVADQFVLRLAGLPFALATKSCVTGALAAQDGREALLGQ